MKLEDFWNHQRKAITRADEIPNLALFFQQGTGKTGTTIRILANKYNHGKRLRRTLIVCPIIVLENWKREFAKFCPKLPQEKIFIVHGTKKEKILDEAVTQDCIIITNFETLLNEKIRTKLMKWVPEILVVDESQRCKNPASKRTKYVIALADLTKNRYILSGTPILNSPMDIWAQYRILDKGETFGKNFFSFRATYFYDKNAGMPQHAYFPDWKARKEMFDDLNSKIYSIAERAVKSECLDLPPLVRQKIYVELSKGQRKLYDSLRDDFVAYLDENQGAIVADLAITKALRLQQIVSGYVKLESGEEHEFEETERIAALKELLEDITPNNKVIIWCVFKHNYKAIREACNELGIKFVEAHGDISANDKLRNVDLFNQDDSVRVFIGHPASLGVGINLVAASYAIYFSRNFSLENDLQSEARNYRGGSEIHEKITRIDLVAKDTIDEQVVESLHNKENVAKILLDNFKR
jgi:SNF2 family DNA or RNA helicase